MTRYLLAVLLIGSFFLIGSAQSNDSKARQKSDEHNRKMRFQDVVDPKRIGVLLPLSGKFAKIGYKALQGIELATKIFKPEKDLASLSQEPSPLSLVVMDDQGDIDRALNALDELFYKHHVIGVIGPIVSKLAEPIARRAQELGLPLLALTQKESAAGDYIFNTALTPAMQIREIVKYALGKGHVKNFAILAPSTKFGEEYTKAFWDEISPNKGFVRGYETYPTDETDFRAYVDRLVGLKQTDARSFEVAQLRALKEATPVKVRSKKFERMFMLKPVIDFEAVFIPDEPKILGQILPTFAYRDVEHILFLGINTWNSQELIARAGAFVEGAVFVDGFFLESKNPASKKFIEDYRRTFGSEPGLIDALAYDAGNIIGTILANDQANTRPKLKDRITAIKDFPGVTGKISFDSGRLTKQLNVLTVKNGKIVEVAF